MSKFIKIIPKTEHHVMESEPKPMFNTDKLKTIIVDEAQIISIKFGAHKNSIELLLNYGFEYDYSSNEFKSIIVINNIDYTITIKRYDYTTTSEIMCYYSNIGGREELKNASNLSLYDKKINNISEVSFQSFIYWIKNIYDTNNIEKDTFKTFVEKDKIENN